MAMVVYFAVVLVVNRRLAVAWRKRVAMEAGGRRDKRSYSSFLFCFGQNGHNDVRSNGMLRVFLARVFVPA